MWKALPPLVEPADRGLDVQEEVKALRRDEKEQVVARLTERLQETETLIVADYRGLSMPKIEALRSRLLEQGARFSVVKNTLTRRAAEAAGADALLALLDGPTAIAFLETGGDPVAIAKTLADAARETQVLAIRGGLLEGRTVSAEEVEQLAKLPPAEVLRGQVLGAIVAPLNAILGLVTAPLQNLHGLIDARIDQLGGADGAAETTPAAGEPPAAEEASGAGPEAAAEPEAGETAEETADTENPVSDAPASEAAEEESE